MSGVPDRTGSAGFGGSASRRAAHEARIEPEVGAEHERAVVIDVVAHVVVGGGRLRRRGLERRMRVDMLAATWNPGCEMPTIPTRPLLFGDVLQQPVDRVVGVGALVDVLRRPCPA